MEDIQKNEIYFIFCQKSSESTVQFEKNNILKSFKKLGGQKLSDNNIYSLYHLNLSSNYLGKPMAITLMDDMAECYMSYIYSKNNEKFKYHLSFEPIYANNPNNLNQVFLPFKTQFEIFYSFLQKEKNKSLINSLFLDTIEYLSDYKAIGLDENTLLFLFIEINKINPKEEEIDKNLILNNFFKKINFSKLFEHCLETKKNFMKDISADQLNILKGKRLELIKITGDKEEINEKIDLFIMFYMIYKKPEYFFEIIMDNGGKNFDSIKTHLLSNKQLFKNFNSEIFNPDFFFSAPTLDSIILVIKGFLPSMLEVLKLFAHDLFFNKFGFMIQEQQKYNFNILDLFEPQKTDETNEFDSCFKDILENVRKNSFFPIQIDESFFLTYCKLFKNENYEKIYSIYKVLEYYNKIINKKNKIQIEQEIIKDYHDTGIFLIENKKLFNQKMMDFLFKDKYLTDNIKEKENKLKSIMKFIVFGIRFDENESEFINSILSNKNNETQSFFGNLYNDFIKKIFEKLTTPEDLMRLSRCEIPSEVPDVILESLLLMIEKIWISRPINYPEKTKNLIAQTLSYSSSISIVFNKYHTERALFPQLFLIKSTK